MWQVLHGLPLTSDDAWKPLPALIRSRRLLWSWQLRHLPSSRSLLPSTWQSLHAFWLSNAAWLWLSGPGELEKKSPPATAISAQPTIASTRRRLPGTGPRIPDVGDREHGEQHGERDVDLLP